MQAVWAWFVKEAVSATPPPLLFLTSSTRRAAWQSVMDSLLIHTPGATYVNLDREFTIAAAQNHWRYVTRHLNVTMKGLRREQLGLLHVRNSSRDLSKKMIDKSETGSIHIKSFNFILQGC